VAQSAKQRMPITADYGISGLASVTDRGHRQPGKGLWLLAAAWLVSASSLHAGQTYTAAALLEQFALPASFRVQSAAYASGTHFPTQGGSDAGARPWVRSGHASFLKRGPPNAIRVDLSIYQYADAAAAARALAVAFPLSDAKAWKDKLDALAKASAARMEQYLARVPSDKSSNDQYMANPMMRGTDTMLCLNFQGSGAHNPITTFSYRALGACFLTERLQTLVLYRLSRTVQATPFRNPGDPEQWYRNVDKVTVGPVKPVTVWLDQTYYGVAANCFLYVEFTRNAVSEATPIPKGPLRGRSRVKVPPMPAVPPLWARMQRTFLALCGGQLAPAAPLTVRCTADGYTPHQQKLPYSLDQYATLELLGTVVDERGDAIPGARLAFAPPSRTATTDGDGFYHVALKGTGEKTARETLNITLRFPSVGFRLEFVPKGTTVYANRRPLRAKIVGLLGGQPAAGRRVRLRANFAPHKGGARIEYVVPMDREQKLTLDDKGEAIVALTAPALHSDKALLNNPKSAFPVQCFYQITDLQLDKTTRVAYDVHSPHPRIGPIRLQEADEETWQRVPSRFTLADPDSPTVQRVKITARGRLKPSGVPDVHTNELILSDVAAGTVLFHYMPPKIGLDLTKQPELWKEMAETSAKVVASILASSGGDYALKNAKLIVPAGKLGGSVLNANVLSIDASKILTVGQAPITGFLTHDATTKVVKSQAKFYTDDLKQGVDGRDAFDKQLEALDYVFGLVDTTVGLVGNLSPAQKLQLDIAKGIYEHAKTFHAVHKQHVNLANAWQDTLLLPVLVEAQDADGHKALRVQKCSVRVWKGGDQ